MLLDDCCPTALKSSCIARIAQSGDNRAEKRFAPVSQPWHAKNESDATNKDRVARYRYKYVDQKTGQLVEAPSAVSSEVHPVSRRSYGLVASLAAMLTDAYASDQEAAGEP